MQIDFNKELMIGACASAVEAMYTETTPPRAITNDRLIQALTESGIIDHRDEAIMAIQGAVLTGSVRFTRNFMFEPMGWNTPG